MSHIAENIPTRHLAFADALEAIYDAFDPQSGDYRLIAGTYGSMIATLRGGEGGFEDASDEALARRFDQYAAEWDEMLLTNGSASLDPSTMRKIAQMVRDGDLLGDVINAEAAQWHRDRQRALMQQLYDGKVGQGAYERWNAKMETHRVSAGYFDGYAGASYRFSS